MMHTQTKTWIGPASFCGPDGRLLREAAGKRRVIASACVTIVAATGLYGFVFGLWRAPLQGLYSAVKMPLLFFSVVLSSALINTMLAQVMGASLSLRRVASLMLVGMTVTALIMASLAPVMLFFVLQLPPPDPGVVGLSSSAAAMREVMRVYRPLLLAHVGVVALAGVLGNVRLYRLLREELRSSAAAGRLLAAWLAIIGFVGCQLSWLFSPFLCHPTFEPHLVARFYFKYNFYEYVWMSLRGLN